MKNKNYYLDTFRVTVPQMEQLTATALKSGGGWCDLYFEYTTYNDLLLKDSEVSSGGFHIDFGVGIRVLSGERTGYAYSESTEMADMLSAAAAASAISVPYAMISTLPGRTGGIQARASSSLF